MDTLEQSFAGMSHSHMPCKRPFGSPKVSRGLTPRIVASRRASCAGFPRVASARRPLARTRSASLRSRPSAARRPTHSGLPAPFPDCLPAHPSIVGPAVAKAPRWAGAAQHVGPERRRRGAAEHAARRAAARSHASGGGRCALRTALQAERASDGRALRAPAREALRALDASVAAEAAVRLICERRGVARGIPRGQSSRSSVTSKLRRRRVRAASTGM